MSDADEIIASLARMRLIGPDERPVITPLAGGISSLIARADTARGRLCVKRALPQLKVPVEWRAPVERNSAEVAWMKFAATVVPGVVPEIFGEDPLAQAFAMAYLDPERHPVWKSQLRDGVVEPSTAQATAERLARIHAASACSDTIASAFANDATFHALRLEPYFIASAKRHPECAPALERLVEMTARTKLALVHGDVSPKNILVGAHGPVLLDAECACYGDPAFDIAFCLTHLMLKCIWRPAHTQAYLACFDAFSAAYLAGVHWESRAALEARACMLLAAMLLARIDGKSPVEYITQEPQRALVRRFAKRRLLTPADRLGDMRVDWASEVRG